MGWLGGRSKRVSHYADFVRNDVFSCGESEDAGLKAWRYERKGTGLKSRRYSCHVSFIFA